MTIKVANADGSGNSTVKTLDDVVGTAGSANTGVLSVQGIASGTNLPVAVASALPAGTAVIGKVSVDQTTPGTTDSVSVATGHGAGATIGTTSGAAVITDANGTLQQYLRGLVKQWIAGTLVIGTGANVIGAVKTDQTTHGTTDLVAADITKVAGASVATGHGTASGALRVELPTDGTGIVGLAAGTNTIGNVINTPTATATAPTLARLSAAASTNATSVKASAGNLYRIAAINTSGAAKFLKFYNKASAPTVGTDTPVFTVPLAANGAVTMGLDFPVAFATGIAYAITAGVTDADTTAVSAGDVHGFIQYL